jgi:DNA processing protein
VAPEELHGWLRLTLADGVGPTAARKLLATFGPPEAIFRTTTDAWQAAAGPAAARALARPVDNLQQQLDATLAWLADDAQQRAVVTLGDAGYPSALLQADDPPVLLYLQGPPAARAALASGSTPGLAVVGSRNPTPQGLLNARQFALALSAAGATIVSGLAAGIDGAAHEGALEAMSGASSGSSGAHAPGHPLPTVAVVGTGLDRVYPKRHLALARRIAAHGVLVSEYPIGTPPLAPNFPRRNRLIAGLSRATLVVEAALASGSLITARLALEQGRDVLAIPGSIHSPQSRGCHALIKQGARLVDSVQDVLDELGLAAAPWLAASEAAGAAAGSSSRPGSGQGNDSFAPLLQALGHEPVGLDALVERSGLDAAALQAQLMALELDGLVARMPGGRFQRL